MSSRSAVALAPARRAPRSPVRRLPRARGDDADESEEIPDEVPVRSRPRSTRARRPTSVATCVQLAFTPEEDVARAYRVAAPASTTAATTLLSLDHSPDGADDRAGGRARRSATRSPSPCRSRPGSSPGTASTCSSPSSTPSSRTVPPRVDSGLWGSVPPPRPLDVPELVPTDDAAIRREAPRARARELAEADDARRLAAPRDRDPARRGGPDEGALPRRHPGASATSRRARSASSRRRRVAAADRRGEAALPAGDGRATSTTGASSTPRSASSRRSAARSPRRRTRP